MPVNVMVLDLDPAESKLLAQFGNVRIIPPDKSNPRNITNLKPLGLLTAETEYIGWFDSDAVVVGDVTKYWIPPNGAFQSRFRGAEEVTAIYREKYEPGEPAGGIPRRILDVWRKDVGENDTAAINTTCTADNFIFHRRHLEFIQRWYDQINKVIPAEDQGVVNRASFAYRQTDEEVMNSLLAFSRCAPPTDTSYMLDRDPKAFFLHFGMQPKPWRQWQYRHLPYYDELIRLVEWARGQGYETPPIPPSLQRRYRLRYRIRATADETVNYAKRIARRVIRR